MKDKLVKRNRINWSLVIVNFHCESNFKYWLKKKHYKIKSKNKLAYFYLLDVKGRSFIKFIRDYPDLSDPDTLLKVIHYKWIKVPEDYEL